MSIKTVANVDKLAHDIVSSWDMDDLISFAEDKLSEDLRQMPTVDFEDEWNNFYNNTTDEE